MDLAFRVSIRRLLVVALVVTVLGAGFLLRGVGGSPSSHAPIATKRLTAGDLLLAASTATGIHLRYTGITGAGAAHTSDIPITSFQLSADRGLSGAFTGGGRTDGPTKVGEITLTKDTDNYSLALIRAELVGTSGTTASIFFTNLSGVGGTPLDFFEINLGGTLVSKYTVSDGGEASPSETISLNFVTIGFKYRIAGTSTTQTLTYNLASGVVGV